jgi:uncharacterized protein with gpF-like domain
MELIKRLTRFAQSAGTLVSVQNVGTRHAFLLAPLRKFRMSSPFKPTAAAVKVYRAVISEKVALIDRLPSKYRKDAQEVVWKSVMKGYDIAGLARELHDRFGIVPGRAQLIASTQCKMARAVIENAQRIELGVTEAMWRHDGERCELPDHRAFNGKKYALARGADLDGKRVWPGSEPQCSCTSTEIIAPTEEDS